jgi:hypothetical protein
MLEKFQAGKLSLSADKPALDVHVYKGGVMKNDQKTEFAHLSSTIRMEQNTIIKAIVAIHAEDEQETYDRLDKLFRQVLKEDPKEEEIGTLINGKLHFILRKDIEDNNKKFQILV